MARATSTASSASGSQSLPPPIQSMTCTSPETTTAALGRRRVGRHQVDGPAGADQGGVGATAVEQEPGVLRLEHAQPHRVDVGVGLQPGPDPLDDLDRVDVVVADRGDRCGPREHRRPRRAPTRLSASGTDGPQPAHPLVLPVRLVVGVDLLGRPGRAERPQQRPRPSRRPGRRARRPPPGARRADVLERGDQPARAGSRRSPGSRSAYSASASSACRSERLPSASTTSSWARTASSMLRRADLRAASRDQLARAARGETRSPAAATMRSTSAVPGVQARVRRTSTSRRLAGRVPSSPASAARINASAA